MLQVFVTSDALQLVLDNQLDILLDLVVIVQNSLLHAVVAIGILEVVDDGDRLIMAFLSLYLVGVNYYLSCLAVSPTTCPLKMLPTVLITTFASLSP